MKKLTTITILCMLGILFGCSQNKQTTVCTYSQNDGIIKATNTFTHDDDKLLKVEIENVIDMKKAKMDKKTEEDAAKTAKEKYETSNINFDYTIKNNIFTTTTTVDFDGLDLGDAQLIGFPETIKKKDIYSLKVAKDYVQSLGSTCKEK